MKDFRERVLRMVEAVGAGFRAPDDDWAPVLLTEGPQGLAVGAVDPALLKEPGRDALEQTLAQAFRLWDAARAALVVSCWVRDLPVVGAGESDAKLRLALALLGRYGPPAGLPRREMVAVEVADAGGGHETWWADITRRLDRPPTLGPWREAEAVAGRFSDVLRRAFGLAAGAREGR